jgi:hypothetical protein
VTTLLYCHFEWKEDAMLVTVPKHKGDQEGSRIFPTHICSKPLRPELCRILSLAIMYFVNSFKSQKMEIVGNYLIEIDLRIA